MSDLDAVGCAFSGLVAPGTWCGELSISRVPVFVGSTELHLPICSHHRAVLQHRCFATPAPPAEPEPWTLLTDADVQEWAPRGPYSWCIDGDDEETFYVVLARKGAPRDLYSFTKSADAARYVAWKNREYTPSYA